MEIRNINISEINVAEYNPRIDLRDEDVEFKELEKSIKLHNLVEPLLYNEQTKTLVGGHQRLKVLKKMGHTEVPCVVINVDPDEEKKINLALNKISGRWDKEKLKEVFIELGEEVAYTIEGTGFLTHEIEKLLNINLEQTKSEYPSMELHAYEKYDYLVFLFRNEMDFINACQKFDVRHEQMQVREGKEKTGLMRVIEGTKLIEKTL